MIKSIQFSDPTSYVIDVITTFIEGSSEEIEKLMLESSEDIEPISRVFKQSVTSLPYTVPFSGNLTLSIIGQNTSGSVVINGTSYPLNEGATFDQGALYQVVVKVLAGQTINLSGVSFLYGYMEGEI